MRARGFDAKHLARGGAGDRRLPDASAPAERTWLSGVCFEVVPRSHDTAALLEEDARLIDLVERGPRKHANAFQMRRIADWLRHAAETSPWWRAHLGGKAPSPETPFAALPLMGRRDFQASVASGPLPPKYRDGGSSPSATSGSSGVPVKFWCSALAGRMNRSHNYYDETKRQRRDLGRRRAVLRPGVAPHDGEHRQAQPNLLQRRLGQFSIEADARWLAAVAPTYLSTWPSALSAMLDIYEGGLVEPPAIEQVVTFAESVDAELRRRTKTVLGARLKDRYSCEEVGPLAYECRDCEGVYHVALTNTLLEVLDADGRPCPPGSVGNVYVTSLHNYASPVLRYGLGDFSAWRPACPCGYRGPVLETLLGRRHFLIRLRSGEHKVLRFNSSDLLKIADLTECRVVQTGHDTIRLEVAAPRPLTPVETAALRENLAFQISRDFSYEVLQVDRIAWAPTRKRQDVISLL